MKFSVSHIKLSRNLYKLLQYLRVDSQHIWCFITFFAAFFFAGLENKHVIKSCFITAKETISHIGETRRKFSVGLNTNDFNECIGD